MIVESDAMVAVVSSYTRYTILSKYINIEINVYSSNPGGFFHIQRSTERVRHFSAS